MEKRKQIKVRWTWLGGFSWLQLRNISIVTKSKELWGSTSWSFLTRSEIKDVNQFPHLTTRTTWKYITWGNFWDTLYNNLCLWRMPSDKMVQLVEITTISGRSLMSWMWWAKRRLVVYLYLKFSIIIIIIMSLLSLSVQFSFYLYRPSGIGGNTALVTTQTPRYLRPNQTISRPRATFRTLRLCVVRFGWFGLMLSNMKMTNIYSEGGAGRCLIYLWSRTRADWKFSNLK